jgi:hypothetical protein
MKYLDHWSLILVLKVKTKGGEQNSGGDKRSRYMKYCGL